MNGAVVVWGTGSAGERHLRVLRELGVDVVAVPTRAARLPELVAAGFRATLDIDDALDGARGAVVATDSGRHRADVTRCLAACPVLSEKPLATTHRDGVAVLAESTRRSHPLHVGCCLRFDEGLAWLAARVASIGEPRLIDIECLSWLPDWRAGRDFKAGYAARPGEGGVLLDLIHEIDYLLWLFGPAARVSAALQNRGVLQLPSAVEETGVLQAELVSGVTATIKLSYAIRPGTRRLRVFGATGLLEWDALQGTARHCDQSGTEIEAYSWRPDGAMYRGQSAAWLRALDGFDASPLADGSAAVAALAVVDAARRSAAERRWCEVA